MSTYAVQQSFTFEWVTMSTHDDYDEASDATLEILDGGQSEDRVRIVIENEGENMNEYACTFFIEGQQTARRVYHAQSLPDAMAMHNDAMPEARSGVLKWQGPASGGLNGITYHMHDSHLTGVQS